MPHDRPRHHPADLHVLPQANAYAIARRRAAAAGVKTKLGNHSFRAKKSRGVANHASTRTRQLYDCRRDEVSLEVVRRIVI